MTVNDSTIINMKRIAEGDISMDGLDWEETLDWWWLELVLGWELELELELELNWELELELEIELDWQRLKWLNPQNESDL